jgi:hypothetical protein
VRPSASSSALVCQSIKRNVTLVYMRASHVCRRMHCPSPARASGLGLFGEVEGRDGAVAHRTGIREGGSFLMAPVRTVHALLRRRGALEVRALTVPRSL